MTPNLSIQDGLSSHWMPDIRAWAADNDFDSSQPTYASFSTESRAHFGASDEFVCKNADNLWNALALAMADHIRYRNTPRHEPNPDSTPPNGASVEPQAVNLDQAACWMFSLVSFRYERSSLIVSRPP